MKRRLAVFGIFFLLLSISVQAQTTKQPGSVNFEFVNQNLRDILYSISTYTKIPIAPDDTVSGTASFQFAGSNFEKAFDSFLTSNRLYVDKKNDIWTVSKIRLDITEDGLIVLDALDASPSQILERLSMKTSTTIVQDILPSTKVSIHIEKMDILETVETVMKSFSDYTVMKSDKYIQVKKNPNQANTVISSPSGNVKITESGGLYDVYCEKVKLSDVLNAYFSAGKHEYSSFVRGDQGIERVKFSGKNFKDGLDLILEQANAEGVDISDFFYILPIQQSDILKKIKDDGSQWERIDLRYISGKDCMPLVQARFAGLQIISLPAGTGFLAFIPENRRTALLDYVKSIDVPANSTPIRLKYIKTENFLKALPPSVSREDLVDTGNGNTFFFVGSNEKKALLQKNLEIIDRPQTRIRYDLFIVQYQETADVKWGFNFDANQMAPGDMSMVSGGFSNLLNLNFDVITVFGYVFAAKMNLALAENQASVFADTTLYGLSGQDIKFQNTNTYRYRDYYIDSATGKTVYTGVTRELTSGLILSINGWVSGDGMITTSITASVSKRGADVSSTVGNPPPTSEKLITTQVRSRSGETVVLSGLKQNDSAIVEERVPLVSKIPLLGWLFKNHNETGENTQMVIYLVPHIDLGSDEYTDDGLRTASIYNRLVVPFLGGME
jgi:hypothetical protein